MTAEPCARYLSSSNISLYLVHVFDNENIHMGHGLLRRIKTAHP